jgi:hypothetical protein
LPLLVLLCWPGSMGGTIEACCLQPIDVIKTRLQLDKVAKYKGDPPAAAAAETEAAAVAAAPAAAAEKFSHASKTCCSNSKRQ